MHRRSKPLFAPASKYDTGSDPSVLAAKALRFLTISLSLLLSTPRNHRQRLHQRQLHRRLPEAERLHRHAGPPGRDAQRLLEDGVGAARRLRGHDDPAGGEVTGERMQMLICPPQWNQRPVYTNANSPT